MSKIVMIMVCVFLLGASCVSSTAEMVVEGDTQEKQAACQLVKEFTLEKEIVSQATDIACIFPEQKTSEGSILVDIHPNFDHRLYQEYISQKEKWEQKNKKVFLFTPIVVDIEQKKMLFLKESNRLFIKKGTTFTEILK